MIWTTCIRTSCIQEAPMQSFQPYRTLDINLYTNLNLPNMGIIWCETLIVLFVCLFFGCFISYSTETNRRAAFTFHSPADICGYLMRLSDNKRSIFFYILLLSSSREERREEGYSFLSSAEFRWPSWLSQMSRGGFTVPLWGEIRREESLWLTAQAWERT